MKTEVTTTRLHKASKMTKSKRLVLYPVLAILAMATTFALLYRYAVSGLNSVFTGFHP